MAQAAGEVSQSTQTVASGIEELNASIKEIANMLLMPQDVATQAVTVTEDANVTMSKFRRQQHSNR